MANQTNRFEVVNNFTKGMNKDLDNSLRSSDMYYDAEDLRLVVNDKGEFGALKNIDGIKENTYFTNAVDEANQLICGAISIRNELIIFTTDNTTTTPSTSISQIYKATLDQDGIITACTKIYSDTSGHNIDNSLLNFSTENKIKGIGRYESSTVKKIYWVDGYNKIRFANVANFLTVDGTAWDVSTNKYISVNQMEFVQDASLPILILDSVINGDITSGIIQYAYQFYSLGGNESLISEFTHPIHVTAESEQELTDVNYGGAESDVFTGKGFKLKLDHSNTLFNRVRLFAIEYKTLNGSPNVRIVEENVITNADTIYFYDSGNSVGEATFEEVTINQDNLFIAEDIEVKDNILFAANITEETFDIEFDARAYRFSGAGVASNMSNFNISFLSTHTGSMDGETLEDSTANFGNLVGQILYNYEDGSSGTVTSNTATTISATLTGGENLWDTGDHYWLSEDDTIRSRIYDKLGNYYEGKGDTPGSTWTGSGLANRTGWEDIPETFDAINPYNDDTNDQNYSKRFIYKKAGTMLGGEGPNVSYTFKIRQVIVDKYPTNINYQSDFTSYSSPIIDNQYRGYARDEVYRFGIIFIDSKGRRSYPKWIGDIRFPKVSDRNGISTYSIGASPKYDFATFVKDTQIYANILYPEFTVNTVGTEAEDYNFEIVRLKRESGDRSILAQGINISTENVIIDTVNQWVPKGYYPGSTGDYGGGSICYNGNGIVRFFSPEISFNKNLVYLTNDYIEVVGEVNVHSKEDLGTNYTWTYKDQNLLPLGATYYNIQSPDHISTIADGKIVSMSDGIVVINDTNYSAYADATASSNPTMIFPAPVSLTANPSFYSGLSLVYELDNMYASFTLVTNAICITNYKRSVYDAQYSGNTYNARSLNNYIRASAVYIISEWTGGDDVIVPCYEGDTFIGMFGVMVSIFDLSRPDGLGGDNSIMETIYVPLETSINLNLRHDDHLSRISTRENVALLQEVAGTHADLATPVNTFIQETDLYLYNTVYSQDNIVNTYFAKPLDFTPSTVFDSRIKNSQVKINGETSDSWTKFLINDYIEVDTKCGPINNIKLFNNRLYYWQDHGFGVVSVNERSLIADNNPGQLVLGTGGVLDRYDYLSDSIGNTNKFGLVGTARGLYWLDNSKKEFYRFSQSMIPLASTKGMKSFLNAYTTIDDVVAGYDSLYEEVLFTIQGSVNGTIIAESGTDYTIRANNIDLFRLNQDKKYVAIDPSEGHLTIDNKLVATPDTTNYPSQINVVSSVDIGNVNDPVEIHFNNTLCFSEPADVFSNFYSFEPFFYIHTNYNLLSVYPSCRKMGTHNVHTRGTFYNTAGVYYGDSKLSILVNDKYPYTKVFDAISFNTNTINSSNVNIYNDTFNYIRFRNDYQNTDWKTTLWQTMSGTVPIGNQIGVNRRESHFSTSIPRNILKTTAFGNQDLYNPTNLDYTQTFKDRIRGKYMIADFKYTNTASNYDFAVSYIKTNYRLSFR